MEHIIIIGGGGTGAALAHDLALRGFKITLHIRGLKTVSSAVPACPPARLPRKTGTSWARLRWLPSIMK